MEQMKTFTVGADTWEIVDGAAREEITDARTGYDGAEYETIGAAIRGTAAKVLENAGEILKDTVTGTTAQSVDDAFIGYPLLSAALYGKSVQNGTPTPESPIPIQVVGGKNLAQTRLDNVFLNAGQSIVASSSGAVTYIAAVKRNTDYTLSYANGNRCVIGGVDSINPAVNSAFRSIYNNASGMVSPKTFNSGENDYIGVYVAKDIEPAYVQLEEGTTATPYTPYGCVGLQVGETVVPIDLQGNTLASLPDGTRDVLKVDSAGGVTIEQILSSDTLNGSENWTMANDGANKNCYSLNAANWAGGTLAKRPASANIATNAICTYGTTNNATNVFYLGVSNAFAINAVGNLFFVDNGQYATVAEFKAALAANPMTVIYELSTQQTHDLGTIEMPEMLQECDLAIYAALDPTFDIEYRQSLNIVISQLKEAIVSLGGTE